MLVRIAAVVSLLALWGCSQRRIPGTDLMDTAETRDILQVIEQYRTAVEGRDAERIAALVSKDFKDEGGTPTPDDDLDRDNLVGKLQARFERLENIKLDIDVRRIDVAGPNARAIYHYTLHYAAPQLTGKTESASSIKEMHLLRQRDGWKIQSGI
jgi:ketosteroid isomerase-like protein